MAMEQIRKVAVPVTVVGLQQSIYEIGGEVGGLDQAIAHVEAGTVDMLEGLMQNLSAVVRERQRCVDELGVAMAEMTRAKSWLHAKGQDKSLAYEGSVSYTYNLQNRRGYDFGLTSASVARGTVDEVTAKVQHESELMTNLLSQAQSTLKDYISQRDKVYSQLEKSIGKIGQIAAKAIREMV